MKLANKDYFNGDGGSDVVFGGGVLGDLGWSNIGPVNYQVSPAHQGLGAGAVVVSLQPLPWSWLLEASSLS